MDAITRLRKERAQVAARLEKIDKILRQYDELDQEAKRLLSLTDEATDAAKPAFIDAREHVTSPLHEGERVDEIDTGAVKRTKTPMKEFEQAVLDVMHETGRPMDRVDLYDALTARGIVIGDGDRDKELNTLSARVYRMAKEGHLVSQRGEGYRLREDGEDPPSDDQDAHPDGSEQQENPIRLPGLSRSQED